MSQNLHPDFQTNAAGTEYFFLGNGKVMAAIQWSRHEALTPLGLLISRPEHFGRKWSTLLFHPEHGLAKTEVVVIIEGKRYHPEHATTNVEWDLNGEPFVTATWRAGDAEVRENFRASHTDAAIIREISITNVFDVTIETSLYANPAHFDRFTQSSNGLAAQGYDRIQIESDQPVEASERTFTIAGTHATLRYNLKLEQSGSIAYKSSSPPNHGSSTFAVTRSADPLIARSIALLTKAILGLRAAVSSSGRFDASIWQYGFEWSGDAAHVAEALIYAGEFESARSVFVNILTRLSNAEGQLMESSRFRGGDDAELNNNGALLAALKLYVDWSGDHELIRVHFDRITAIAEYLLTQEHLDANRGMLKGARDIWERSAMMGVEMGYDVSHNSFGIVGLEAAAELARTINKPHERWTEAALKMRHNFLEHPTHSFIENGKIIKRRLMNGKPQRMVMVVETDSNKEYLATFRPKGTPMEATPLAPWEPDASTVFPICHGFVDPKSEIARKTMASLEELWSQAWKGGGYGRYHVAAEPDSPGPWPFATSFIASAYAEMGDMEHVLRALEWLIDKAGASGSWFEFYGERPTPPLPPTGIIVWGWAQYITLIVRYLLGMKVIGDELVSSPKLSGIKARLRFRERQIEIDS